MSGLGTVPFVSSNGSLMTNYARIGHAAQQVFPDILQVMISIKEPKYKLYADVSTNLFLNRNLRADEWSLINNVRANGYVNFDIPLIYKLVRNLNLVPPPTKGWDFQIPPASTEILPGDDVERIRRTRNEILHRGNAQVSDSDLIDYFTTFKSIAVRLEAFLGKPRGEFLSKIEYLETCCMDEETEQIYLKRLTSLREQDINVLKAVEDLRLDLDNLMFKESHQIEIEEWEEQNKLFIKTDAVDFVLASLTDNNCCTVIGTSGIGKSATIHHVALFLRDTESYRIIPIHSPSDIEKYFQRNRKQIFIIDDICGKYTVIQAEVEKWIKRNDLTNRVLKQNSNKVLASCRIQVFNESQFKRLQLFTNHVCNLSSDIFCLSPTIKLQIARQYLPESAVKLIKNDLENYEFLPLMFALYKALYHDDEHIDAVKFFRNPFNIYTSELEELWNLLDKTKFCALFLLVIHNGCLDIQSIFKDPESELKRQTREDFFEDCGIPRNTLRKRILEQLESLVPLFIRNNYDNSRQVISFSPIHDKTFDFLCFYYGKRFQVSFLRFADSEMIYERTMLKSLVLPEDNVEEFTILIDDFHEDEFFKRIEDHWSKGKFDTLFYSRQMNCDTFRNKLINFMNKLPKQKCRKLILFDINNGESVVHFNYIDDGCSGSVLLSPLCLAFKRNFTDLVKYILNFINDTNGKSFSFLLIKACSSGLSDVVKILIHMGTDINVKDANGWTPLIAACEHGHTNIVEILLKFKVNVSQPDSYGWTPLMRACGKGYADIVKTLIKSGVEINHKDKYGQTPFLLGIENGHLNVIEILLSRIPKYEVENKTNSPLIYACNNGLKNVVKLLIQYGANINIVDIYGMSPLSAAVKHGYREVGMLLLAAGSIFYGNSENISVLMKWAFYNDNTDIVPILTNVDPLGNAHGWIPLIAACINAQEEFVKSLLIQEANVNVSDENEMTPLTWSCKFGHRNIIKELLANKANLNLSDNNWKTPLFYACKKCDPEIIKCLLDLGANPNQFDRFRNTPLMVACERSNVDIVRLLIDKGAEVNSDDGSGHSPLIPCRHNNTVSVSSDYGATLLSLAVNNNNFDMVRLLIERKANVNVSNYHTDSPLLLACKKDNNDIIRLLLEQNAKTNVSDISRNTPLIYSCQKGNNDMALLLIESGADINISDACGRSPLLEACENGNKDMVRLLIDRGATVDVYDEDFRSPLLAACENGNYDIAQLLIKRDANDTLTNDHTYFPLLLACTQSFNDNIRILERGAVNVSDEHGRTCLLSACKHGNYEMVKLLIERGAQVNVSDKDGCSPLLEACKYGSDDMVRLLVERGREVNAFDENVHFIIFAACENGMFDIVQLFKKREENTNAYNDHTHSITSKKDNDDIIRFFVEKKEEMNFSDLYKNTRLVYPRRKGNIDMVGLLIANGADVNISDAHGSSPLLISCENGNTDMVRLLIEKGADANIYGEYGRSPLLTACENGHMDMVRLILDNGAAVNIFNHFGQCPFLAACENDNDDIIQLLIQNGADVNISGQCRRSPLLAACENSNDNIVRLLIEKGAEINVSDECGRSPLLAACENCNLDIVRFIIEQGVDINAFDDWGYYPLLVACENDNDDMLRLLIEGGAVVNVYNDGTHYPLLAACVNGNNAMVRFLFERGAVVNVSDNCYHSPLVEACENGNEELVRFLIEQGVAINVSDDDDCYPLIAACEKNKYNMVQFLLEKGAKVNINDNWGVSPLSAACRNNNNEIVELLIENGAVVNADVIEVQSPLVLACKNDNVYMLQLLTRLETDHTVTLYEGNTLSMLACKYGSYSIAKFLIEHGSIHESIHHTSVRVKTTDIQCINHKNELGQNVLMLACMGGNKSIVSLIISKTTDVNVRDSYGMTALFYACKNGFSEIIEVLMLNGAHVLLKDKHGKTPLTYANENKDRKIVNLLTKHLYKSQICYRKRKVPENEPHIEVTYERAANVDKNMK